MWVPGEQQGPGRKAHQPALPLRHGFLQRRALRELPPEVSRSHYYDQDKTQVH